MPAKTVQTRPGTVEGYQPGKNRPKGWYGDRAGRLGCAFFLRRSVAPVPAQGFVALVDNLPRLRVNDPLLVPVVFPVGVEFSVDPSVQLPPQVVSDLEAHGGLPALRQALLPGQHGAGRHGRPNRNPDLSDGGPAFRAWSTVLPGCARWLRQWRSAGPAQRAPGVSCHVINHIWPRPDASRQSRTTDSAHRSRWTY